MAESATAARARRGAFAEGVRDQLPILLGVIPFGLIFGALAVAQGIPGWAAQGLSLFVFAGSSQFVAAELVGAGAPSLVIVFTILVVNLRHLLYSASLAPYLRHLPARWRVPLAWLLTDEAFATTSSRLSRGVNRNAEWYMLGTGLTLWWSWQISTAIGILLGAQVPASWSLDFALPLTFMALIAPSLVDRPALGAALVAGVAAVALSWLPFRLGLVLASLMGISVGVILETLRRTAPGGSA
jgi:4-azaleucine resistance transporter AzlC